MVCMEKASPINFTKGVFRKAVAEVFGRGANIAGLTHKGAQGQTHTVRDLLPPTYCFLCFVYVPFCHQIPLSTVHIAGYT